MEHQAWERVLADKDAELDRLHDQLDDMADRAVEERRVRAHLTEERRICLDALRSRTHQCFVQEKRARESLQALTLIGQERLGLIEQIDSFSNSNYNLERQSSQLSRKVDGLQQENAGLVTQGTQAEENVTQLEKLVKDLSHHARMKIQAAETSKAGAHARAEQLQKELAGKQQEIEALLARNDALNAVALEREVSLMAVHRVASATSSAETARDEYSRSS